MNDEQERQVKELRYQLEISKMKAYISSDFARSAREMPKLSVGPGQITPKAAGTMTRVMSPDMKGRASIGGESMLHVAILEKQIK